MSIYRTAVKNPVTTGLVFLAFAIFGIYSLTKTSIAQFPDFDANVVMVMSSYQGASASDIENNLTKLLENTLNSVENLKNIANQLMIQEEQARERICSSIDVRDTIARSLGILRSALVITHDEALKLLSNVRLGISSGQIKDVTAAQVDELMTAVEPATLSVNLGKTLSPHDRDIERATLLRNKLA